MIKQWSRKCVCMRTYNSARQQFIYEAINVTAHCPSACQTNNQKTYGETHTHALKIHQKRNQTEQIAIISFF